jgi:hypothetical protein
VVLDGVLQSAGMASFKGRRTPLARRADQRSWLSLLPRRL